MRPLLCALFVLVSVAGHAQWSVRLGLNLPPAVLARTVEITSAFSRHPGYALTANLGYVFGTTREGFVDNDIYDGVQDIKTSGAFAKVGARIYPFSWSGRRGNGHFYIGALAILSEYRQTAQRQQFPEGYPTEIYAAVSTRGMTLMPAATIGFKHNVTSRLSIDWGVQKSFVFREDDYISRRSRNYRPGAGSAQTNRRLGYFQGILSLKYRIGSTQ